MHPSFWKRALASLPPQVQYRYAGAFEAAERFEAVLDAVCDGARRLLALSCRASAWGLATASRFLHAAARRLAFSR